MELRVYQREACESAWLHLCSQAGNPVVVLPTGAGKSVVIAELCRAAVEQYSGRVIVLAHRKELLEQNAEKIKALLSFGVSCGLYSAGLNLRNTGAKIIVAGIQSVFKRAEEFGERHLVLIDEVHLVPHESEGMYRKFIDRLREINPRLRMIGLTATPYRTGEGSLCRPDGLFQKICYEASIPKLIGDGYLSPITNQVAAETVDTSGLHVRAGEFIASEVERLFDSRAAAACKEIAAQTRDRKSVLVFCAGVSHASNVAETLEQITGEPCGVITGGTTPLERAGILSRFRSRQLRYLCNVDVLTTGYDAPCIDAIAILRATCSPGLFAQICGRGFRVFPGKENCLILDFGENIKRHGPLDAIDFGKPKSKSLAGDAPTKKCPNCEEACHAGARECPHCGWRFPARDANHGESADQQNEILAIPKEWLVEEVRFSKHRKRKAEPGDPDTLRVDYLCQPIEGGTPETISEWICIDHDGWAGRKAHAWWRKRSRAMPEAMELSIGAATYIDSCIELFNRGAVASPVRITTVRDGKFWRITKHELDPIPEEWFESPVESEPWIDDESLLEAEPF